MACGRRLVQGWITAVTWWQIGVLYGNPETTSGGIALRFFSSVRVEVRRKQTIEGAKGENIGIRVRAKVGGDCMLPPPPHNLHEPGGHLCMGAPSPILLSKFCLPYVVCVSIQIRPLFKGSSSVYPSAATHCPPPYR